MAEYLQCMASVSEDVGCRELIPVIAQFVEYDQRAHKLQTLAQFSFWVPSEDLYNPSVDLRLIIFRASTPLPPISSHWQRLPLTQCTAKAASQLEQV